jgi:hypothetical protein
MNQLPIDCVIFMIAPCIPSPQLPLWASNDDAFSREIFTMRQNITQPAEEKRG